MFDILFWFFAVLWAISFIACLVCIINKRLRENDYYLYCLASMLVCQGFLSVIRIIEVVFNA